MARVMASELSPRGIRVNVVSPRRDPHPDLGRCARDAGSREGALRSAIAQPRRSAASANPTTFRRRYCSSPPTMPRMSRAQELFVDGGATASPSGAPIYRGKASLQQFRSRSARPDEISIIGCAGRLRRPAADCALSHERALNLRVWLPRHFEAGSFDQLELERSHAESRLHLSSTPRSVAKFGHALNSLQSRCFPVSVS